MPKRIIEISSSGPDEYLQLIGGDPFGGSTAVGLRVPTLALKDRYLFNGCALSIAEGAHTRILGYRQLVTIGQGDVGINPSPPTLREGISAPNYPRFVEQEVLSPMWRFPDGNVWMGLRRMGGPNWQGAASSTPVPGVPPPGTSFQTAMAPSLLYQSITLPVGDSYYPDLTAYVPPNQGRPWGQPIQSGNDWLSLQTSWRTWGAWHSMDLEVEGPDTIAIFISVLQSDPDSRTALAVPDTFYAGGLSPEEQFLLNYPEAIYWRVGASLIVELS